MVKFKFSNHNILMKMIIFELFLMIFATTSLMPVKMIILAGILGLMMLQSPYGGKVLLNYKVAIWIFTYILIGIFPIVIGLVNRNPNPTSGFIVTTVEPLIYLFLLSYIDKQMFYGIKNVLPYITLILYIYIIFCFFCLNGVAFSSLKPVVHFFWINRGGTQFASLSPIYGSPVTWMYFLEPLYISRLICGREELTGKQWRIVRINVVLGIICTICVLKTALILTTVFSFVLAVIINEYRIGLKVKIKSIKSNTVITVVVLFIVFCFLCFVFSSQISGVFSVAIQKVKVSLGLVMEINRYGILDAGGSTRMAEVKALLEAWAERPIFGWGSGIGVSSITRSVIAGDYEMTFFSRLMQSGLIMVIIREFLIGWLYINMLRIAKKGSKLSISAACVTVGLTGMLFANFTNPLLESFDRIVILFLPLLIYKLYCAESQKSVSFSKEQNVEGKFTIEMNRGYCK